MISCGSPPLLSLLPPAYLVCGKVMFSAMSECLGWGAFSNEQEWAGPCGRGLWWPYIHCKWTVGIQLKGFLVVFLFNFSEEDTLEILNCPTDICHLLSPHLNIILFILQLDDIDNVELYRDYISALWSHGLQDKLVFSATTQKLITSCSKLLLGNKDLVSIWMLPWSSMIQSGPKYGFSH